MSLTNSLCIERGGKVNLPVLQTLGDGLYDWWRSDSYTNVSGRANPINQKLVGAPHGEDHDLRQDAVSNARPIIRTGGQNGLDYLEFEGGPGGDVTAVGTGRWATPISQPYSMLFVFASTSTATNDILFDGSVETQRAQVGISSASGSYYFYAGNASIDWATAPHTNFQWLGLVYNGASSVVYNDGNRVVSSGGGNPGTNDLRGYNLGSRWDFDLNSNFNWYETRIWQGVVTNSEWEGVVTDYMSDYYDFSTPAP